MKISHIKMTNSLYNKELIKIEPISKSVILKSALAVFRLKPYKTAFFEVAISKFDILKSPQFYVFLLSKSLVMKIRTMLIIILCLFSCTTQPEAVKNWFPDDITNLTPIDEYIHNFSTDDINIARDAYCTVLAFIEEVVDASHENLERAHRLDSPTAKRPAMINGRLAIIEDTDMTMAITKWDEFRMERIEVVSVYASWEFVLIIEHSKLYNNLLNYWYSLTGELLGEPIDVETVYKKLLKDHALLLDSRCFEVFE